MKKGFTDTKIKVKLGKKDYLLKFGVLTRRRIEEKQPSFNLLSGDIPEFEILPLLVSSAIKEEDKAWQTEEEFLDMLEELPMDVQQKIISAYQNSVGFTSQTFLPVVEKVQELIKEAEQEQIRALAKSVD